MKETNESKAKSSVLQKLIEEMDERRVGSLKEKFKKAASPSEEPAKEEPKKKDDEDEISDDDLERLKSLVGEE